MDYSVLQNMLMTFIPALSVLLGFVATAIGVLVKLKQLLKNSNLDEIRNEITDSNSTLNKRIDLLLSQVQTLNEQNADLKKRNNELLGELKRISNYGEE